MRKLTLEVPLETSQFTFERLMRRQVEDDTPALQHLKQQLSPGAELDSERLQRVVGRTLFIWVCRLHPERRPIAMASLCLLTPLEKDVGHVEDVLTDEAYRGRGYGKKLLQRLIKFARSRGLAKLKLTSKDERVHAIKLYTDLGFVMIETNVFALTL